MLVLLALVAASIVTDSLVTIAGLSKLNRLQGEVCHVHERVLIWERIVGTQVPVSGPLLGDPPAWCRPYLPPSRAP